MRIVEASSVNKLLLNRPSVRPLSPLQQMRIIIISAVVSTSGRRPLPKISSHVYRAPADSTVCRQISAVHPWKVSQKFSIKGAHGSPLCPPPYNELLGTRGNLRNWLESYFKLHERTRRGREHTGTRCPVCCLLYRVVFALFAYELSRSLNT